MNQFPRKLLLALGMPLMFTACATMGPPKPPSLDLPKPPSDLRATRKSDKVTLTWTAPTVTTDRGTVRALGPTRICRGLEPHLSECGTPAGEAAAFAKVSPDKKLAATYTDTLSLDLQQSKRSLFVTYAVEVLNQEGHSAGLSNQVRVLSAATLGPFFNFAAAVTAQGVQLSWAAPPASQEMSNLRYTFRIYRRQEGSATADKIADLDLQHCWGSAATTAAPGTSHAGEQPAETCPLSYLDQTFEWEKTYFYHGTVVSVVGEPGKQAAEIEGDDTPDVKVFADDVFPPAAPSGLQPVFSGSGQQPFIDLIWAPVADVDLDGYNIYRHEEGTAPVKVNKQLVRTPAYRDADIVSGKNYVYSVSAVDVRGNESARSEETSERVP
ncbi:MAG: hypothetical protein ABSE40_08840 [Candidatus Sulfotelmatobacter sp.]|jgi:hypothetical protein